MSNAQEQIKNADGSWECKRCGTLNDANASVCRVCKAPKNMQINNITAPVNENINKNFGNKLKYAVLAVVILLGIAGGAFLVHENADTTRDKTPSSAVQQSTRNETSSSVQSNTSQSKSVQKNKAVDVDDDSDDGRLQNNADGNEQDAANALNRYYQSISHRNMQTAYNILSDDMQSHMGSLENFQSGYQTTLSNRISDVSVVSSDPGRVVLSYTLTSRDRANGGIKVQTFDGMATMSNQTGSWHIVDLSVKKAGEHFE